MIDSLRPVIRAVVPLALALSVFAPVTAQSDTCAPDTDYIARAEASLDESQFAAAIDAYSCGIQLDPESYESYLGRASATILAAAVRGEVDFNITPDLNLVYDQAYGLITEAIATATGSIQQDPEDLEALALRGYLYWYTGQNQNALADFDAILREDDGNVFGYIFRGAANLYLGNEAKATADFDNAVELAAEPAGVHAQVGAMYANTGDPERGLEYYNQAIELAPETAHFYSYRAYTYDRLGDTEAAIADYTSAIELDPENEGYYLSRAFEYETLGDYAAAAADYASALEINPENANTYQLYGWALIEQAEYDQAIVQFDAALALAPEDRWSFLGRATAQAELGDNAPSARDFESYIELTQAYLTDADPMKPGNSQTLEMSEGQVYAVPLNADAGTTLEIQATAQGFDLDPLILLVGIDGVPLAGSDDIASGNLNAAISVVVPESGRYTLLVTHAGGGSYGTLDVEVIQVGATTTLLPTQEPADVPVTACASDGSDEPRALTYLAAGDYEGAYTAYDCLVQADPTNSAALMRRGLVGLMFGPTQAAFDDISDAETNAPDLVDELLAETTDTLEISPNDLYALTSRAYLRWFRAMDDLALQDYDAILEIDPNNAFALLFRGSSSQYLGDVETATADFERVAERVADNPAALSVIAYSYIGTDDDENGLDYLNQALDLDPDNTAFLSTRAELFGRAGDIQAATADMDQIIALEPDNALHFEDLGWLLLRAERYEQAISAFNDALEIDETLVFSVLGRATSETALGDVATGAASYASYVEMMETNSAPLVIIDTNTVLEMSEGTVYRLPLTLDAGQTIDIAAISPDTSVDPLVLLFGPDGTPLIGNDDVDEDAGDFNAGISGFVAPESGEYVLLVTHSGSGSDGPVEVSVAGLAGPQPTPTRTK